MFRCYAVLLEAHLHHLVAGGPENEQPLGYHVVRYVLASSEAQAIFRAEKLELSLIRKQHDQHRHGEITVTFRPEEAEVWRVSMLRLFRRRYGRAYWMEEG